MNLNNIIMSKISITQICTCGMIPFTRNFRMDKLYYGKKYQNFDCLRGNEVRDCLGSSVREFPWGMMTFQS